MGNQLQAFVDCLQGMWAKPVHDAGFQATKAKVVLYGGKVDTPCGTVHKNEASGFYCNATQKIYLDVNGGNTKGAPHYTWTWYLSVAAHEYGHHVQARTGILRAGHALRSDAAGARRTELTHRLELQAECFSGMGMRRTARIDRKRYTDSESHAIGDAEHGSRKNIGRWGWQGYTHQKIYQCGTYNAKSSEVS